MKTDEKPLSAAQLASLVKLVELTDEQEFNCGDFLVHAGEFAEGGAEGRSVEALKAAMEKHLMLCPECHEEYEALMKILEARA